MISISLTVCLVLGLRIDLVIALRNIACPLIRTVPVVARAATTLTLCDGDDLLTVERSANYSRLDIISSSVATSAARGVLQVRDVAATS